MAKTQGMTTGESAAHQKLFSAFERSKVCFPSVYSSTIIVPVNGSNRGIFQIDSKGDFLAEFLTGKIYAIDSNGAKVSSVDTGVTFNVNESGNSRDLFLSPIPAETILAPGYGSVLYEKWNLRDYQFKSNAQVTIAAANSNTSYRQVLEMSFIGYQFIGGHR